MIYTIALIFLLLNVAQFGIYITFCNSQGLCFVSAWGLLLASIEVGLGIVTLVLIILSVLKSWQFWNITKRAALVALVILFVTHAFFNTNFLLTVADRPVSELIYLKLSRIQEQKTQQKINQGWLKDKPGEVRFTGTVQSFSTTCTTDGDCSLTIDGKVVIIYRGGLTPQGPADSLMPKGHLIGLSLEELFSDFERFKGRRVEVYAKEGKDRTGNKVYSIYGSENYYISLLPSY